MQSKTAETSLVTFGDLAVGARFILLADAAAGVCKKTSETTASSIARQQEARIPATARVLRVGAEARGKSAQVDKTARTDEAYAEVEKYVDTGAYITFSDVPKFGANPKYTYATTPYGFYGYPLTRTVFEDWRHARGYAVKYAAERQWVLVWRFKDGSNVLEFGRGPIYADADQLDTARAAAAKVLAEKLAFRLSAITGTPEAKQAIQEFISGSATVGDTYNKILDKNTRGHFLTGVQVFVPALTPVRSNDAKLTVDGLIRASIDHELKSANARTERQQLFRLLWVASDYNVVTWNKKLRDAGWQGVADSGTGTVHANEPMQGVALDPRSIEPLTVVANPQAQDPKSGEGRDEQAQQKLVDAVMDGKPVDILAGILAYDDWRNGAQFLVHRVGDADLPKLFTHPDPRVSTLAKRITWAVETAVKEIRNRQQSDGGSGVPSAADRAWLYDQFGKFEDYVEARIERALAATPAQPAPESAPDAGAEPGTEPGTEDARTAAGPRDGGPSDPPAWLDGAQRVSASDAKLQLPLDGGVWLTNDGPWFYVPAMPLSTVPRVRPWSPTKAAEYADLDPNTLPPIVVEAKPDGENWRYEIVDGEHRVYAARLAKLSTIPAYVGYPVEYPRMRSTTAARSTTATFENRNYWVDPDGQSFPFSHSHDAWALRERGETANGLLDAGWIRVAPPDAVQVRRLGGEMTAKVERIVRALLADYPGRAGVWVETDDDNYFVGRAPTGRPDFSSLRTAAAGKVRTAGRIWAFLREGETPGAKAGVFLRIPRPLADQFPKKRGDDESPAHFTLAYILGRRAADEAVAEDGVGAGEPAPIVRGKPTDDQPDMPPLNDQDRADIVAAVNSVVEGFPSFNLALEEGVDWFENQDGDQIANKSPAKGTDGEEQLAALATRIRDALGAEGFVVSHADKPFLAHSTLDYLPTRTYMGPVPEGHFDVKSVELWGWPETWIFDLAHASPAVTKAAAPVKRRPKKPEYEDVCPHCDEVIYEKHVMVAPPDFETMKHRDCGGIIEWAPEDSGIEEATDAPEDVEEKNAAASGAPIRWAGAYPRFQRNAHGEYEEEHANAPGQSHPHADGAIPGVNEQVTNEAGQRYRDLAQNWGTVTPGAKSDLRFYDYRPYAKQVDDLIRDHGYEVYYAGGQYGKPDLANRNYQTGHLMVYDPSPGSGGDFGDEEYTRTWRSVHELAHAKSLEELNQKYGEGRRIGKLGWQRTPREAKRAVEWEWLAAHKQRELGEQMGYYIDDATFNKEINTVLHDAVHRAITGQFTNPDQEGFVPSDRAVPLEVALAKVDEAARAMGLADDDALLTPEQKRQLKSGHADRLSGDLRLADVGAADAPPATLYAVVTGDALVAASQDDDFATLQREAEAYDPRAPWTVYQLDNVPVDLARKLLSVHSGVGYGASFDSERALIEAQPYITEMVAERAMARRAIKKWKQERRRRRRLVHQVWYKDPQGFLRPSMAAAGAEGAGAPEAVPLATSLKIRSYSEADLLARALERLRDELTQEARQEGYEAVRVGDRLMLVTDSIAAPSSLSDEEHGADQ